MTAAGPRPAVTLRRKAPTPPPAPPAAPDAADALGPPAHRPGGRHLVPAPWRLPAGMAAAVVLGVSAGNVFVAVAALLLAAGPAAAAPAALAAVATVARWGTAHLGAVAGDQAVLGAAVVTGSVAAVGSSLVAALALVLAARRAGPGWEGWVPVAALGLGAGVLAAGPSPVGLPELAARVGGAIVGTALAAGAATLVIRRPTLERRLAIASLAAGAASVVLAVVA